MLRGSIYYPEASTITEQFLRESWCSSCKSGWVDYPYWVVFYCNTSSIPLYAIASFKEDWKEYTIPVIPKAQRISSWKEGNTFDVGMFFDGTLYWSSGTLDYAEGTIKFTSFATIDTDLTKTYLSVCRDKNGYPWVLIGNRVYCSSSKDSFSIRSGFPRTLDVSYQNNQILPLSGETVAIVVPGGPMKVVRCDYSTFQTDTINVRAITDTDWVAGEKGGTVYIFGWNGGTDRYGQKLYPDGSYSSAKQLPFGNIISPGIGFHKGSINMFYVLGWSTSWEIPWRIVGDIELNFGQAEPTFVGAAYPIEEYKFSCSYNEAPEIFGYGLIHNTNTLICIPLEWTRPRSRILEFLNFIRKRKIKANQLIFSIKNKVSNSLYQYYKLLRRISRVISGYFKIIEKAISQINFKFSLSGLIRQWLTSSFFVKVNVSALIEMIYGLKELIQRISYWCYNVKELIKVSFSNVFTLLNKLSKQLVLLFNILKLLSQKIVSLFSTIGRIKKVLHMYYLIGYIASKMLGFEYSILSIASRILSTIYWNLKSKLSTLTQKYLIREKLTNSLSYFFNILKKLQVSKDFLYSSFKRVKSSLTSIYSYFLQVFRTLPIVYHVGYYIIKSLVILSSILKKIPVSISTLHSLFGKRISTIGFQFNLRKLLTSILSSIYTLPGKIVQILATVFNTRTIIRGMSFIKHSIRKFRTRIFVTTHKLRSLVRSIFKEVHGLGGVIEAFLDIGFRVGRIFLESIFFLTRRSSIFKVTRPNSILRIVKEKFLYKFKKRILKR